MKLSEQEAKLFFELMWSLQYFVAKELNLAPKIKSVKQYEKCNIEQKQKVRKALFSEKNLIDAFVQENPYKFSDEKLAIVSSWKHYIAGDFYIERYLKKYTIFINETKVYGVLGLHETLDEIIPNYQLPLYVKAILLQFNDKIIYDGLLHAYDIFFGKGIIEELKNSYMSAKRSGKIIERLDI